MGAHTCPVVGALLQAQREIRLGENLEPFILTTIEWRWSNDAFYDATPPLP